MDTSVEVDAIRAKIRKKLLSSGVSQKVIAGNWMEFRKLWEPFETIFEPVIN